MAYNDKLYRNYLKNAERERALWENLARQKRLNDAKEKELDKKEWGKRTDLAKKVAEPATKIVNAVGKSLNAVGKSLAGRTR